jgi:2-dehydropantoate 2-reductase
MDTITGDRGSIAIIGGGAIGGLFAAAAQAAGLDVTVCVRTPIPRLEIQIEGITRTIPVRIATDAGSVKPVDWVVLAMKAQDTPSAAPWLQRMMGSETMVVAAQNGIEHEQRIRPLINHAPLVPALVYVAVERIAPGRIVHHTGHRVVVPAGTPGAAFARALAGNGLLDIETHPDFITAAWLKLLSNIAANPLTALTMRRMDVFSEPAIHDLARALLLEAAATATAAGAHVSNEDAENILSLYQTYNPAGGSSMLYDRLNGSSLEHDHLTGAVVRAADRHGIAVPLNRAVLALLDALDRGIRSAGTDPLQPIRAPE